jgi:hypothetical protein
MVLQALSSAHPAPIVLAALMLAPAAFGQAFVQASSQLPQGSPFNNSRTQDIDFGDIDLDGDLDVVMADGADCCNDQNRLWVNLGGLQGGTIGFFEDHTATQYPVVLDHSRDVEFADVDNDGDLDVSHSNTSDGFQNQTNRFVINQGGLQGGTLGFFADETQARWVGLADPTSSLASNQLLAGGGFIDFSADSDFADLDSDGDLDLVHTSYGGAFGGQIPTRIFLNDGQGHFQEHNPSGFKLAGQQIQPGDPALWAEGLQQSNTLDVTGANADVAATCVDVELGDLDGDFDIDIVLGDVSKPPRAFDSRLTETGVLIWRDVTGSDFPAGYTSGNGHYEQELGDFDNDGDLDLYGLNWFDNFHDETLENVGGIFTNTTWIAGSQADENEADWGDYDNDGDLDVYVANFSGADRLYRNELVGSGSAALVLTSGEIPPLSGVSMDADFGDIDDDGDQDVLIGYIFNKPNDLYLNVTQVPDTHAPRAVHLEQAPDRVASAVPTRVRVHVYDNAAYYTTWYATVELEFRIGSGPWYAAPMRSSGGQLFRGEIPGALIGAIEYRVRATDAGGNAGLSALASFTAANGGCDGSVATYCTSKPTSIPGCLPSLALDGVPSASAPLGCTVSVVDVPGGNVGLFLYTTNGAAATPIVTPFGSLCIQSGPGLFRIGMQSGGGTSGVCDGGYAIDFNQHMHTQLIDPALAAGASVDLQCWYRDPPNPGQANLTAALRFQICP